MPLGGIGTGSIALCGDGSLRQWQIHNQVNHLACVPHSFFAVWARRPRADELPVARILQSRALYDTKGPDPPPTSNDHMVPAAHRALLKRLPGVEATEFVGEYPVAELTYHDPALPLRASMQAYNPFIPLNSKDSALPAIIFNLTLTNPTQHVLLATAAATLQNAVGWDGVVPVFDTKCSAYGGNFNTLVRLGALTAVNMGAARLPEDDDGYGSMALATLSPDATYLTQWDRLDTFWSDFSLSGQLSNTADTTPSPAGRTWNAALAMPMRLAPGESRTIRFIFAWHFPNHYVNYSQRNLLGNVADDKSKFWIGNQYAQWFRSALEVVSYIQSEFDRLSAQTLMARDVFHDSTLPPPLVDAVTSQMSIIRSPTCFWAGDGRFYGFEGCAGPSTPHMVEAVGGCCPLNCTHVWNYEMSLARLFPDLERTMRETEWNIQQHPSGYLPHRVLLPTYLPRPWDRDLDGPKHPAIDGLFGAILKTYREYRAFGDDTWLKRMWPAVKAALHHIWSAHDPERTGVLEGEQPNTYDISIYGANTFIGTLYLCALRAAGVMARQCGEPGFADDCDTVFARGRAALEARLWNGEYYVQDVDFARFPEQNWGKGCHTDQLLGQWWAHVLGLGHLLDAERARTAALSILRHNFRENFRGHQQRPRVFVTDDDQGLLICTWPHGGRPPVPTPYSDEVWTGIEYEVAALLLYESETEPALRLVEAARTRYDGRKQNPWNDIECGDHYVRAMASWTLLEAASGYSYDAAMAELAFKPVLTPADFRAPFVARDGWGVFSQTEQAGVQTETIALRYGTLAVKTLHFRTIRSQDGASPAVTLGERALPATGECAEREIVVTLAESATLSAGDSLTVRLTPAGRRSQT
jgi:uncharacterized protein (DUF608 family)